MLKILAISLGAVSSYSGGQAHSLSQPNSFQQAPGWGPIHNYIQTNSSNLDEGVEEALYIECVNGTKTWSVSGNETHEKRSFKKFDLKTVGWPSLAVYMPDSASANQLASMIDMYRYAVSGSGRYVDSQGKTRPANALLNP